MSSPTHTCPRQLELARALATNAALTEPLRAHVATCNVCAATLFAYEESAASEVSVASSGLALWRIRLRERREREERLARPLVWGERFAALFLLCALLALALFADLRSLWAGTTFALLCVAAASVVAVSWVLPALRDARRHTH